MGYMRHHAIVVSGLTQDDMPGIVLAKAREIFGEDQIGKPVYATTNGYWTLLVPPDGSKEGWDVSNNGNTNRDTFIAFLKTMWHYVEWVEVQYADDEGMTCVCRYSDDEESEDEPK